jgi:hypothetical protein
MNKIEKILNKKTLSAQDKVILENELFAILGRVEGYLNNMFENTTKKKLAANQKNAPHSNPAFSKTQAFSLNLTKQV